MDHPRARLPRSGEREWGPAIAPHVRSYGRPSHAASPRGDARASGVDPREAIAYGGGLPLRGGQQEGRPLPPERGGGARRVWPGALPPSLAHDRPTPSGWVPPAAIGLRCGTPAKRAPKNDAGYIERGLNGTQRFTVMSIPPRKCAEGGRPVEGGLHTGRTTMAVLCKVSVSFGDLSSDVAVRDPTPAVVDVLAQVLKKDAAALRYAQ